MSFDNLITDCINICDLDMKQLREDNAAFDIVKQGENIFAVIHGDNVLGVGNNQHGKAITFNRKERYGLLAHGNIRK